MSVPIVQTNSSYFNSVPTMPHMVATSPHYGPSPYSTMMGTPMMGIQQTPIMGMQQTPVMGMQQTPGMGTPVAGYYPQLSPMQVGQPVIIQPAYPRDYCCDDCGCCTCIAGLCTGIFMFICCEDFCECCCDCTEL